VTKKQPLNQPGGREKALPPLAAHSFNHQRNFMKHILAATLVLLTASLNAQFAADVLRYSALNQSGSARFLSSGGAFTALGADFSTLSQNPAGLAFYRSNELVLSPAIQTGKTLTTLHGGNTAFSDDRSAFGFDNLGFVFNTIPQNTEWKSFNVGIGVNRINNFHQSWFYEGSAPGSIMNALYDQATAEFNQGIEPENWDPFFSKMAYDASGLYFQNQVFSYDFQENPQAAVNRSQQVGTYGRMNEIVFAMAGNYQDKLMIGATLGAPIVHYRLESVYRESDDSKQVNFFDNLTYTDYLATNGYGLNGKFGLTLKANQALRIGAAFHTPTLLFLTDNYNNSFEYTYTDNSGKSTNEAESPRGVSDYRLRTPWRAMAGAALVFAKFNVLSADIELVDYRANAFNLTAETPSIDNQQFESSLNQEIQRDYRQTINYRLGTQLAFGDFRLRGGVGLLGKSSIKETGFNTSLSGGIGIITNGFYVDLGYRRTNSEGSLQPYPGAPKAVATVTRNEMVLTLGVKF
jgi:hypothetical protein